MCIRDRHATIQSFAALKGHYVVKLVSNSHFKQIYADNLCLWHAIGTQLLSLGFPSAPELDGHLVKVEGFDTEGGGVFGSADEWQVQKQACEPRPSR